MRAKMPGIETSTYSKPANLPGFLLEFMGPRLREFSPRYGGGNRKVSPRLAHVFLDDVKLPIWQLFVAQGFDGIEAGGAEGWDHAADQSHQAENERGGDQGAGSDDEADVAGFSVLGEGTI